MFKRTLLFSSALLAGVMTAALSAVAAATPMPVVLGTSPAPPKGAGPGKLMVVPMGHGDKPYVLKFGRAGTSSGNSFYIASWDKLVYVPSVAGYTDVINIRTGKRVQRFNTIAGGRVAALSKNHQLLFVLSAKHLAAYSAKDGARRYQVSFGGNAMALNGDGSRLYVGGNMDKSIAEIDTSTGFVLRHIPIGHSGDMVWANGYIFSADMKNGVMTAFNPMTNKTYAMATPEADPRFSYHKIPMARAGFMQLAVSPDQYYVYAAGFSGHILRFATHKPAYLGEVAVTAGKSGANKLSGLALVDYGERAISTVENRHESVIVNLRNGHIVKRLPHVASNRWILAGS
jgi:hypothetical protein